MAGRRPRHRKRQADRPPPPFHRLGRQELRPRSAKQITDNLRSKTEQLVDARSAGRFAGTEPEPRPGLRGGHIPGSKSLPYDQLFNEDGTYKSADQIAEAFKAAASI
jgi:3-mercaptopyruvate sulfurtransferase SseA